MSRSLRWILAILLAAFLASMLACGSDDDGDNTPASPSGLALTAEDATLWVGAQTSIEADFIYDRTEAPVCLWYVNDLLGGDVESGTITQDNPAIYTAPQLAPTSGEVEILAVWSDDESVEGMEAIEISTPEVEVLLTESQIQVAATLEVDAVLTESRREADQFEWYVNNVLGGNATYGTITQTTPATYTAPSSVPVGGAVEIKARWAGNPELFHDSANLAVLFTIKHVNAATGVDDHEGGRITSPYKTIGYALQRMSDTSTHGDTILVAPGVYGPENGELFAKTIKWETTLRGVDRDACIIDASPTANTLYYMSTNSTFEHFTIRNLGYPTSTASHAVEIQGPATIRDIKINEPFYNSAIRVTNPGVVGLVEDCEINNTLAPGESRGLELAHPAQAILRNCNVVGWDYGIMVAGSGDSRHIIEGCSVKNNYRGVMLFSTTSDVDLGGGLEGSLGGNVIQNNDIGIYSQSTLDISALNNTWGEFPPTECGFESDAPCDIFNNNSGSIIWE